MKLVKLISRWIAILFLFYFAASAWSAKERHAFHILVKEEATAAEILAKFDNNLPAAERLEIFKAHASKFSIDSRSSSKGGDIGWVSDAALVRSFSEALFQAPLRKTVGPFETIFGWHLIYVLAEKGSDEKPQQTRALTNAELRSQLLLDLVPTITTEKWEFLGNSESRVSFLLREFKTPRGSLKSGWTFSAEINPVPVEGSPGKFYRSVKTLWWVDCPAGSLEARANYFYEGFDGSGSLVDSRTTHDGAPLKLSEAVPGTTGNGIVREFCIPTRIERPTEQSPASKGRPRPKT